MDWTMLLVFSTPIALAALGEIVGQRSGVLNIGLEGMMLSGAFFAVLVADATGSLALGIGAGVLAGLILSLISAWFTVKLAADQVVVGTAVNFLALGVTGYVFRTAFGQTGQLLNLPPLPKWLGIDPVVASLLVVVPFVAWLLMRTHWGLVVRAAGEYPKAVEAAGFSVERVRIQALAVGGVFAGLAGAYLAVGVANSFAEGMTAGRGFIAIALVTFGRWRPLWVVGAGLLVGYAQSLQFTLQGRPIAAAWLFVFPASVLVAAGWVLSQKREWRGPALWAVFAALVAFGVTRLPETVKIPPQLWLALPYVLALTVLVLVGRGTVAPSALGLAYRRER